MSIFFIYKLVRIALNVVHGTRQHETRSNSLEIHSNILNEMVRIEIQIHYAEQSKMSCVSKFEHC